MVRSYKDLDVWKKSVALTTDLYNLTSRFPASELYGLVAQTRRASTPVAADMAEGWGRGSRGESIQFLTVARGSLMELETHLMVACNLRFIQPDELDSVWLKVNDSEGMLNRRIAVLRGRKGKA